MGDLPYRVEYAKSARSSCKGCGDNIGKEELRLAVVLKSTKFDGTMIKWYHFDCFFRKQKVKCVDDIAHFQSIRWEDQEKIRNMIEQGGIPKSSGSTKKKGAVKRKKDTQNSDFEVQYAVSSRATCKGCEQKIAKGDIRISKKDYESEEGRRFGGVPMWHHLECFPQLRDELEFWDSASKLPGFSSLKPEDQQQLLQKIPQVNRPKKAELEETKDEVDSVVPPKKIKDEKEEKIKKQNKKMFKIRDELKALKKPELAALLEANNQEVPSGNDKMLDRLADCMTFGALIPCEECKTGQYVFRSGMGYFCLGNKSEWQKCEHVTDNPKRVAFKIPQELKDKYPFLQFCKCKPEKREFYVATPSTSSLSSIASTSGVSVVDGHKPKVERNAPLLGMSFVMASMYKPTAERLKTNIVKLGGKVANCITKSTAAVISTKANVDRLGSKMEQAQLYDVQVVPESFIAECMKLKEECAGGIGDSVPDGRNNNTRAAVVEKIRTMNMAPWGSDPAVRITQKEENFGLEEKTRGLIRTSKKKLKIKHGVAVDPDSELEDVAHVYRDGQNIYTTAMSNMDLQSGKNSYYKMQILESDNPIGRRYWLFRSWGRIGTTVGDKKCDEIDLQEAVDKFRQLFEEKTGNLWENRGSFRKMTNKMVMMDISYDDDNLRNLPQNVPSKLSPPVQDLISLIFNVSAMKDMMLEYELDLTKMPLGKLSKQQIQNAYRVLTDLQSFLDSGGAADSRDLIGFTNQFYTLIPHDFGHNNPAVINNLQIIERKREMLDNLLEIEIAYSIVQSTNEGETDCHYLDMYYRKLKTDIDPIDKCSEEFGILQKYVKNTHAQTHDEYDLEIVEAFKVQRHGEDKRYKPFRQLHNRKLLWHGSRLTNYVGILSQGLRIAPPEAPSAGYMFGKGIYFADMVSKSANYCNALSTGNTGLILLCEVALGNMWEKRHADFVKKLPPGKHSVKGLGKTMPDPSEVHMREDGVEIPYGKGVPSNVKRSDLLYNEYIVYDVAQLNIQYLLRMNFVLKKRK